MRVHPLEQGMFYECVGLTDEGLRFRLTLSDDHLLPPGTWEHYWTVAYDEFRRAEWEGRTDQLLIERRHREQRSFIALLSRYTEACA